MDGSKEDEENDGLPFASLSSPHPHHPPPTPHPLASPPPPHCVCPIAHPLSFSSHTHHMASPPSHPSRLHTHSTPTPTTQSAPLLFFFVAALCVGARVEVKDARRARGGRAGRGDAGDAGRRAGHGPPHVRRRACRVTCASLERWRRRVCFFSLSLISFFRLFLPFFLIDFFLSFFGLCVWVGGYVSSVFVRARARARARAREWVRGCVGA
jgi:hypothetical protein